jgi:2-isopropylmalate synthase
MNQDNKKARKVWIQDVTLRDGNQALKKPWNLKEKESVFDALVALNVNGIEVGFPSSNSLEFEASRKLAKKAPSHITIAGLSRAIEKEISITWDAIQHAKTPRLHIVYPVSAFQIQNVLRLSESEVLDKIYKAVSFARTISGSETSIQFSGEHFGDASDNFDFALKAFQTSIEAGATIINLPNTVERYRPFLFVDMVRRVKEQIPESIGISVHTHNDLGMATATTVESFYAGAMQLEVALNGLGERAGNTNLYETAVALHQCGEVLDLNFQQIYPTAKFISELTGIPVGEKTPIIGADIFAHRSGIHQDGVTKTIGQKKGAYRTFSPDFVGRGDVESLSFTNQSGSKAIQHLLKEAGMLVDNQKLTDLFHKAKEVSSSEGNRAIEVEELLAWAEKA